MATTIQVLITKCAWFLDPDELISNFPIVVKQEFTLVAALWPWSHSPHEPTTIILHIILIFGTSNLSVNKLLPWDQCRGSVGEEFSPIHPYDSEPGLILPYILNSDHTGTPMHEKSQTHPQVAMSGFSGGGVAAGGLLLCLFVIFFATVLFGLSSLDSRQVFYIKTGISPLFDGKHSHYK